MVKAEADKTTRRCILRDNSAVGNRNFESPFCIAAVIRRYVKPRCTKNVVSLPCEYRVNQRACMTRELFSEWLLTVNEKMRKEGRHIFMIVGNCAEQLRLEYLLQNCTSVLQPLDQGIKSIKSHFQKHLVQRLLIYLCLQHSTAKNG
ncbi:hypothetical protein HPB49_008153 [Dermacentor silvarum]|uniref:Uncharacterized protein n=1 Tax=Dermacentor silvarum TaxID=543639 RepID=A0ACB8D3T6_DERSI|nr:hypothetical protein HPB49_008153 [Dermacentor silvarum]